MTHTGPFRQQRTDDGRCSNCVYFESSNASKSIGDCKRYPPVPTQYKTKFPVVDSWQWCGEWQPREQRRA